MRCLLALIAAMGAFAAFAPAASAQQGPDAGLNEFFFHGAAGDPQGITSAPPAAGGGRSQQALTPRGNPETPNDPLVIRWQGTEQTGIADGKEVVFRWFFSSPNAGGVLVGVGVDIRLLAVNAANAARVIGKVDDADLLVGAQPRINETVVPATGAVGDGERLFVQVRPRFVDTGPGLTANYDSQSTASGFSVRDPLPTSGNPGIDGLPSADPQGLEFSATVPADPQRDESEPNIEIDGDGNIYTCGPTGVSNAAEYAQVSFDGGNQFRLIGEDPRGQQAFGGGGDCGFATAPERNPQGLFNYAYSGLGPLTNFATAASSDNGRTLRSSPSSQSIPGVDRQWHTFLDADSVLLSYNQQAPRQVVVQRSDDGGVNYGAAVPATSTNPGFPGPMHALPADLNPDGADKGRVAYFAWNRGRQIFLAMSFNQGRAWHNCKVAESPGTPGLFATADNDRAGNIYVAYSERTTFHSYVSVLPADKLKTCIGETSLVASGPLPGAASRSTEVQAAVNPPIQIDRDKVRTSLFAWVSADGAPGRFAVTFYGSETDGDPNVGPGEDDDGKPTGFRGAWDVYVSQSLNALAEKPDVAQVKATTHPFHYDSICLNGLGCSITLGDRSLADFFAMDFNPNRHTLSVVYNQGYKRPDDEAGDIATPAVINQIAGPTLDGEPIRPAQDPALDNAKDDPEGDAIADFSRLCLQSVCPATATNTKSPGVDLRSVKVSPQTDIKTGAPVANGGFDLTMSVADLKTPALQKALQDQRATSLIYIFRWINGFRSAAVVAKWDPARGFRLGFNDYVTGSVSCGSTGSKCLTYPGDQAIPGKVDQAAGTITFSVPRAKLKALEGSTAANERPKEVPAVDGSRFYDGTAFSLAATAPPDEDEQSFLYPFDGVAAFDFLVGGALPPARGGGGGQETINRPDTPKPGPTACQSSAGFRSVSARRSGRSNVRLNFARRVSSPVTVDVFRVSEGRRVVRERLVARFPNRSKSFVWNGVSNREGKRKRVGTGYYFVRYTMLRGGKRIDVRRKVLRRAGGRFSTRPDYYRRDTCDLLNKFKLERPVFGGPRLNTLKAAYRLSSNARVTVTILKGSKVVKRYAAANRVARRTYRITLPARRRARGDYRVRLQATSGGKTLTSTLTSRRL